MKTASRLIFVLWLRQMRGYWRSGFRIAGSLVHPILYLTSLGAGLGPIFQRAGEGSYFHFLVPGIVAMSILFAATFSGTDLLWERRFGVLKEAFVSPTPPGLFILGRALGSSSVAMIHGLIVVCICVVAGFRPEVAFRLPVAIAVMILLALLFASLGLLIGCLMPDHSGFQVIMNVLILPMSFLSGAFYPLKNLPAYLHTLSCLDPLSYGVDALRIAMSSVPQGHLYTDIAVLSTLTGLMMVFATTSFARLKM